LAKKPVMSPGLLTRVGHAWSRTPEFVKWIGYGGTIFGAIFAFSQAVPVAEPLFPAHRAYVREVAEPVLQRVIVVQLAQNDDRHQRLIDEAAKRELELQSDQAKQLPQYRVLVQGRVDRIKSELKTIDEQNNSLFKEQKTK